MCDSDTLFHGLQSVMGIPVLCGPKLTTSPSVPACGVLQCYVMCDCRCDVDPEQAVALGAAIQAAVLLGLSSGVELMDGSYVEEFHNRSTGF